MRRMPSDQPDHRSALNHLREVHEALDRCLARRLTFACWRSPGSAVHLAVQHDPQLATFALDALSKARNVFLVNAFDATAPEVLRPDLVMTFGSGAAPDLEVLDDPLFVGAPAAGPVAADGAGRDDHLALVTRALEAIRTGDLHKVVVSRQVGIPLNGASPARLFLEACDRYPRAFVCLFRSPRHGVWSGASPERLLRAEDGRVEVDAIAGTLPADVAPSDPGQWSDKERHEQDLVTRAVLDAFLAEDVREMTVRGPEVLDAGPVHHLHSRITGLTSSGSLARLVHALHPTPAVCGTPRQAALAFIGSNEPAPRGLYAGYWGPWQWYGRTELAVNIRCLQLADDRAQLHVGGGITAESDPGAEWEETEVKARTWREAVQAASPR